MKKDLKVNHLYIEKEKQKMFYNAFQVAESDKIYVTKKERDKTCT